MKKILLVAGAGLLLIGLILLGFGFARVGESPAKLTWSTPEVKGALMTFAYKVYGSPKIENGRLYLSKITFKNSGQHPIRDFSISYKLDGYIPWTEPEVMHEIPGNFSFVKLYYPRLPAEVSKLRTATNTSLLVKVRWKEEGREREEDFRRDVLLRAVNEFSYCDLPQNEVQSWQDAFNCSMFSVAMVTPNDPVIALYAAEISKAAGGSTAGAGGGSKEVYRLCQAAYDYMCRTGLRYVGTSGVPDNFDNISTLVQTVRLPRDVVINNNGLCIELTLFWAAILEQVGVKSALVYRPGHAYIIAYSPEDGMPLAQGIPIECTAVTPRAVGKDHPVSFEEAVKMSVEDLKKWGQDGRLMILPVDQYQRLGFTAPELPDVDLGKLGDTLAKRLPVESNVRSQQQTLAQRTGDGVAPSRTGPTEQMTTWRHPQGYVSVSMPASFASMMPAVNPGNVLMMVAGDVATTIECDVMHVTGTQNPQAAFGYIAKKFGEVGVRVAVEGNASGQSRDGRVSFYGSTQGPNGLYRWVCSAKPVPNGVVFVGVGASARVWSAQAQNVESILSTVRFK